MKIFEMNEPFRQSVPPSIHPSIHLSVHPYIHHHHSINPSIHPSIHPSIILLTHPSIHPSIDPSIRSYLSDISLTASLRTFKAVLSSAAPSSQRPIAVSAAATPVETPQK